MKIRAITLVIGLAVAPVLTACGSDGDDSSSSTTAGPTTIPEAVAGIDLSEVEWVDKTGEDAVTIQTRDNTFLPGYVVVKAGTPITFNNVGRTEHNALPVDEISFVGIEADALEPRAQSTITIDEPGDYPYYCSLHGTTTKGMVGAIRVVE